MPIAIKKQLFLPSSLRCFADNILNNTHSMSERDFAQNLTAIQKSYMKTPAQRDYFCTAADKFADRLLEENNLDFAGIIISKLCKITEDIPSKLEKFLIKGYEIAKKNGDYIHIMARLNSLRKIYYRKHDKLRQYIQVLYKQEKYLEHLTQNYETTTQGYHSLLRAPASKNEYLQMLAHVQVEISKITKRLHPQEAIDRLNSAEEIFHSLGNNLHDDYISMLISEAEQVILRKSS